jgi:hypothetical protein
MGDELSAIPRPDPTSADSSAEKLCSGLLNSEKSPFFVSSFDA